MDVAIESSWKKALQGEFVKPYFATLVQNLKDERTKGKTIFPAGSDIFNAFKFTPFNDVEVVILGQDPYHGPGQAHGLSFSVKPGVATPPSLQNIYKEIQAEYGYPIPRSGNLESWARQGVLLLNAALTVEAHQANSHAKLGWHSFTDEVIYQLATQRDHLVFMLWGKFAQSKSVLIPAGKHLVLKSAHPSPLSAHNGFFGNGHFKAANDYLEAHGKTPIDWQIPA
ncbi:MAG: uracil-DNA glycosylase [Sphingobacteriales bacterium]|nr:MAG: uracil-DNA glycosylase [Sphingobacteriales bacterium]